MNIPDTLVTTAGVDVQADAAVVGPVQKRIPPIYKLATPHNVLPIDTDGNCAFSLTVDGQVHRFQMTEADFLWVFSGVLEYLTQRKCEVQSASSDGSLSPDVSEHLE
jgi:hypothetical protein